MPRSLHLFAACALALIFCLPGHGQDSPSLGDLARQAQKDKSNAPAKKVFTNDDLPSSSGLGSSGPGAGLGQAGQLATPSKQGTASSPSQDLERMESMLNQVDSLDRATLVKNVLQGADSDFPGRSKWEERLFAAKHVYVSQGRALLQKAKQLEASTESLQGIQNPNDPRVKDMNSQLQQLAQEATRTGAAFQAVILEGRDLATQSSSRSAASLATIHVAGAETMISIAERAYFVTPTPQNHAGGSHAVVLPPEGESFVRNAG